MANIEEGFLLVADITGYTSYLSRSELDHAQEALTALLNLLIEHTRPPLVISRLAGDAVISYGLSATFVQAQTFLEMIEDTYVAFRRAIELMVLNTTCVCNACRNLPSLDLKFFVHFGVFGIQRIDAHDELIGSDVILLHRLLKNRVTEVTGVAAYTLYTDSAIRRLGLEDATTSMASHQEEYEHVGEVSVWIQDMHEVWDRKRNLTRIALEGDDILIGLHIDIALPAETIWDFLVQPEHFNVLAGGSRTVIGNLVGGRVGEESVYQCYHGDVVYPQTILEWRPFERIVVQFTVPVSVEGLLMLIEYRLAPIDGGTRLSQTFSHAFGKAEGRLMAEDWLLAMAEMGQSDLDRFGEHVCSVAASAAAGGSTWVPNGEAVVASVADGLRESLPAVD